MGRKEWPAASKAGAVPARGARNPQDVAARIGIRHARSHAQPILDLTLLAVPSFRLSVIGGSLTRITQGAQPFLLPMMLQLGFGMTAAASGAITAISGISTIAVSRCSTAHTIASRSRRRAARASARLTRAARAEPRGR